MSLLNRRCLKVADAYQLHRETVAIAMHFLDTFLVTNNTSSGGKKLFQLASMTSLFIAAKLQEQKPVGMSNLVSLSRGVFKADDLKNMEKLILRKLKWRCVCFPLFFQIHWKEKLKRFHNTNTNKLITKFTITTHYDC